MRYLVLFVLVLSFVGCSTRFVHEQKTKPKQVAKVKEQKVEFIPFQEPEIVDYKPIPKPKILPPKPKELTKAQIQYNKRVTYVQKKAAPHWGKKAQVATKYNYVKYVKDFKARTIIDFENGVVKVETTDTQNPIKTLQEVISSSLLNPQNPEDVDLFSTRNVTHVGVPFLHERVVDFDGQPIRWQWRADRFAKQLIERSLKKQSIKTTSGYKTNYYVTFKMKQDNYSNTSELNYASIVKEQAKRFGLESALIFALIETESHFNPYATSAIPAYGLMQVVPNSAGRDAWKFLKKTDGKPTRNYLFNARNNIEMGSAYMHILQERYLSKITNDRNRELCAIAAYNTGSGNVLESFHKNRDIAASKINSMSPSSVYNHLRKHLPYKETRDYIKKVTEAKKRYL
ncbi:murein transglycosylase domain-containing protein [Sulfurimonas sp.]|uniref:murein transglycosylase domain-containing protein n=1 Tax=Sulfurimonas sp. TaxID=2022749 RepID=UPI003561D197